MHKVDHHKASKAPLGGWKSALGGIALLWLLAMPAQALVVSVDIGWGYGQGWTDDADAEDNLRDLYNLQEGSIVQIIMFNYADNPDLTFTGGAAGQNFEAWGGYDGPDLSAEPYGDVDPDIDDQHVPIDSTRYDPESAPPGHVIAYTTTIGDSIAGGGGYWYNIYAQFEILGTYDQLYVRVFGATNFPLMEVVASYWGLSTVQTNPFAAPGTWYVPVGDLEDIEAPYKNYFEVIPEPGTLALFVLGGVGLWEGHRRRRKSIRAG